MFSEQYGLQQAVLEGRKTMTRRALPKRVQAVLDAYTTGVCVVPESAIPCGMSIEEFAEQFAKYPGKVIITHKDEKVSFTPSKLEVYKMMLEYSTYKVGDVVAVAQRYSELSWDKTFYESLKPLCNGGRLPQYCLKGWDNKMFVRAELMPHRIRITNVRIERIQDISDEDCIKEGIYVSDTMTKFRVRNGYSPQCANDQKEQKMWYTSPRQAFAALIQKLSGKKAWGDNPCVFVYEFELVQ